MKQSIVITLLLLAFRGNAQQFILPGGEYMDTTVNNDSACKERTIYYYQVGGKYPESSVTILEEAKKFLRQPGKTYNGSGYITFRFRIDCAGNKTKRTQVLQTDEQYKAYHFNKAFVNELYLFLNTLNNWKAAKSNTGNSYSYIAFITFKIKDGKVINIIP